MTVKELLTKHDMSQVQLSKELDISIHTIKGWCSTIGTTRNRSCPDYIISLMDKTLNIPERNINTVQTVSDLLTVYGLSQSTLSREFGIPLRTVQNWVSTSANHRDCPDYVLHMMDIVLHNTPHS